MTEKIRRNGPCPCGSGKKAKRCCLPRIKQLAAIPPQIREQFLAMAILNKPLGELDPTLPVDAQVTVDPSKCTIEVAKGEV